MKRFARLRRRAHAPVAITGTRPAIFSSKYGAMIWFFGCVVKSPWGGRQVQIINAFRYQRFDEGIIIAKAQTASNGFFWRKPHAQQERARGMRFNRLHDFINDGERKTLAIFCIAAPVIFAAIEIRREEILNQETVRAMQLNAIKPCANRAPRGLSKSANNLENVFF